MVNTVSRNTLKEALETATVARELRDPNNTVRDNAGLTTVRKVAEILLLGVFENAGVEQEPSNFRSMTARALEKGIISQAVADNMNAIRLAGNKGAHEKVYRRTREAGWAAFDSLLGLFDVFPTKTTTPSAPIKFELKAEIGAVKSPSAAGTTWAQSRQPAAPTPPKPTMPVPISPDAPSPFIIVLCLAIIIIAAGAFYNSSTPKSEPVDQSAVLTDNGMLVGFVATQNVNVRDRPTAKGSILFGTLPRGTQFGGVSVNGVEQTTKWVRVGLEGGTRIGYIWAGSLQRIDSAVPPRAQTEAKQLPKEDVQSAILRDDETARQHASQSNNAKPVSAPQTALSVTCILPSQRGKPPEVAQTSRVDCIARSGIID